MKPADCVVVEDSPLGVAAAGAAGMKVFGYAGMTDPAKLSDADAVFHDMTALADLHRRRLRHWRGYVYPPVT